MSNNIYRVFCSTSKYVREAVLEGNTDMLRIYNMYCPFMAIEAESVQKAYIKFAETPRFNDFINTHRGKIYAYCMDATNVPILIYDYKETQ